MQIHGFQKTTLLDFPGKVAATVFTGCCNFRCPFCHNADLVLDPGSSPLIPEEQIMSFLKKRQGILDGIAITGGEPTLQGDLLDFMEEVKKLGYEVKLDTNGYRPEVIEQALSRNVVDYIAMDIKSSPDHYAKVCGMDSIKIEQIKDSVRLLLDAYKSCDFLFEFRTTVVRELHTLEDFKSIADWVRTAPLYFLQSYKDSDQVMCPGFSPCSRQELEEMAALLAPAVGSVQIRGID